MIFVPKLSAILIYDLNKRLLNRRPCQSSFIIQKNDFSKRDYRAVFVYFSINTAKNLIEIRRKEEIDVSTNSFELLKWLCKSLVLFLVVPLIVNTTI